MFTLFMLLPPTYVPTYYMVHMTIKHSPQAKHAITIITVITIHDWIVLLTEPSKFLANL